MHQKQKPLSLKRIQWKKKAETRELCKNWWKSTYGTPFPQMFEGIDIVRDLNSVEDFFKLRITVYEPMELANQKMGLKLVRSSKRNVSSDRMMLLMTSPDHVDYIYDLPKASTAFVCRKCRQVFEVSSMQITTAHTPLCNTRLINFFP